MPRKVVERGGWWRRASKLQKWLGAIVAGALAAALGAALTAFFSAQIQTVADTVTGGVVPLTAVGELHDPGGACEGGEGWVYPAGSHGLGPLATAGNGWAAVNLGIKSLAQWCPL